MKRGEINPYIGMTDAALRTKTRSALRKVWRESSRAAYVKSVRVPYMGLGRFKFGVDCSECGRHMGQTEKEFQTLANGNKAKKQSLVYQVDHINENHSFTDIKYLGEYAYDLFYGEQRILCVDCHKKRTKKQRKKK